MVVSDRVPLRLADLDTAADKEKGGLQRLCYAEDARLNSAD